MPTPDEITLVRTPPNDASSSRASFASCPPEDDREYHAPREERIDPTLRTSTGAATRDEHMITQEPTPEPEAQAGASAAASSSLLLDAPEKAEHVEDVGGVVEESHSSTAGSPEAPSESDTMSKPEISSPSLPQYLTFPRNGDRVGAH